MDIKDPLRNVEDTEDIFKSTFKVSFGETGDCEWTD